MAALQTSTQGIVIPGTNKVIAPITVTILADTGNEIGFITEIDIRRRMRVERIRDLSGGHAGRVIEQVPYVEDYELACSGYALYTSTTLARLYGSENNKADLDYIGILIGRLPCNIKIEFQHPGAKKGESGVPEPFYLYFYGCYPTDYSTPIRMADIFLVERITLQPTSMKIVAPSGTEVDNSQI
jgi:hypothetical protein